MSILAMSLGSTDSEAQISVKGRYRAFVPQDASNSRLMMMVMMMESVCNTITRKLSSELCFKDSERWARCKMKT